MPRLFTPDLRFNSVTDITAEFLISGGFHAVAADLDNTLAAYADNAPPKAIHDWVETLRRHSIPLIVVSNAKAERVAGFCTALGVPFIGRAGKPMRKGYLSASAQLGFAPHEILFVGDQIFTDTLGAHRSGMTAALVEPVNLKGQWLFRMRRKLEMPFIKRTPRL